MKKPILWSMIVLALVAAVALVAGGCKKSSSKPVPLTWTVGSTVYIVGSDSGYVTYWTNGVKTHLAANGSGNGIMVVGSDVYVGGTIFAGGTVEKAAVWKNGVETDFTDTGVAWAFQPGVRGTDVYVPGYVFGPTPEVYPVVWKNGQRVNLDSTHRGIATGMAIVDTDIYVVGQVYDGQFDTALIWKNGQRLPGFFAIESVPFGQILASESDFYLAFQKGYYKNAQNFVQVANTDSAGGVGGLFVAGSDVYAAGKIDSSSVPIPAYWKNGNIVELPSYKGSTNTSATGIVVAGSDVYVIGETFLNGAYKGLIWKNGVLKTLTGNGELYGIVVQ
jgi:hypothetical protein